MKYLRHALLLSASAFVLHLIWEYAQCSLFFVHKGVPGTHASMTTAILGDVLLAWIAQVILAGMSRRWFWHLARWNGKTWVTLLFTSVALAFFIEWRALSTDRWAYTAINPLLPGTQVSILPILQLCLLLPLNFGLLRLLPKRS